MNYKINVSYTGYYETISARKSTHNEDLRSNPSEVIAQINETKEQLILRLLLRSNQALNLIVVMTEAESIAKNKDILMTFYKYRKATLLHMSDVPAAIAITDLLDQEEKNHEFNIVDYIKTYNSYIEVFERLLPVMHDFTAEFSKHAEFRKLTEDDLKSLKIFNDLLLSITYK